MLAALRETGPIHKFRIALHHDAGVALEERIASNAAIAAMQDHKRAAVDMGDVRVMDMRAMDVMRWLQLHTRLLSTTVFASEMNTQLCCCVIPEPK